jgi:hypothetical protein
MVVMMSFVLRITTYLDHLGQDVISIFKRTRLDVLSLR